MELKAENKEKEVLKVFLIVSHKSDLDDKIEYFSELNNEKVKLEKLITKSLYFNNENFTASIYSFNTIPEIIKDNNKEIKTKKYKAIIKLKYDDKIFTGSFLFKENKNNFIYDFQFEEIKNLNETISPPIQINFSKLEQLKLYNEILKKFKIKQGEPLSLDLIIDSQFYLFGNQTKYYFDFYLEIFKLCFLKKEVKLLILLFKLNKIILPKEMKVKDYSNLLDTIEKKPHIITKYCNSGDNKEKYYKIFYTILLYFRANYEKEKVSDLLNKKELWKYYIEILPINHEYFNNIEMPEKLIKEILLQKNLSYEIIKGTLSYINSIENILITINNYFNIIYECIKKENRKLNISEIKVSNISENFKRIIFELEKIIKYELEKKELFILIDEEFFNNYNNINDKKDLEKLEFIKNSIFLLKKLENNIEFNKKIINNEEVSNEDNIINKRLLMPTIGNVSVGKSYFLNSLFGIDFCQVNNGITTKFILFIRHIDKLKKPKLYNIYPVENSYNSFDFVKRGEIIMGEEQIRNKIIEINSQYNNKYIVNEKPIFYILEIEIKSIKNKEFLNKFDFLDIPGLNESGEDYIELYFKYIKDMIKYCLFIFSTENYNSKICRDVINKVKRNICVPIENFLLILNKIDKVNGKIDQTLYDFKKVILKYNIFNYCRNTIIPVNSLKLKSEIQTDFYNYINYYFIEYTKTNNDDELSFIEFIQRKLKIIYSDSKKLEIIKNEIKIFDKLEYIEKILIDFIEEKKGNGFNLLIDIDDKNDINILKQFYICFKNKLIFPQESDTIKAINKYFAEIKDYSLPIKENGIKIEKETLLYDDSKENKLLKELNEFFINTFSSQKLQKYGNIVKLLNKDFKILNNYLLNSKLLFIPVLGISNSGKSSFINCLLKKDILSTDSSECTRRGIIIKYINDKNTISLFSIKFKFQINEKYHKYYYYTKENLLSNKIEQIIEIINILNEDYPMNEEDSFLLLEINIPVLDDLQLKPEIKSNVCFIDFPGHNTNNNFFFDNNIYQNVLKMSSFFIYINSGKAFKEDSNKLLLSKLYKEVISLKIEDLSPKAPKEFIDLCLFVFNKADTLEKKEKNLKGIESEIKEILCLPKEFEAQISTSLFSSKIFKKFINNAFENNVENIKDLLVKYYKNYKEQENNILDVDKEDNFLNYFLNKLSKKIKSDYNGLPSFNDEDQNNIISSYIFIELNKIFEDFYSNNHIKKDLNHRNNLLYLSRLLIYCKNNILKSNYYKESYASETFEKIQENIIKSSDLKRNEFINHLERCFYFMNTFYKIDNSFISNKTKEELEKTSNEMINNIKTIFNNFNFESIIDKYKKNIIQYIDEMGKSFKKLMKKHKNDLNKIIDSINKEIYDIINKLKDELVIQFGILQEKIWDEVEKIGVTTILKEENKYKEIPLSKKILIGTLAVPATIIGIPLYILYGIAWELPSFVVKKIINATKKEENKFQEFLVTRKGEINEILEKILNNYKSKTNDFKISIIENSKRVLGLIEANNIETDDFWNETKKQYEKIYENYKNIK